jgi:hypothetical protein
VGTLNEQITVAFDTEIFILIMNRKTVWITMALVTSLGWASTSEAAMDTRSQSSRALGQETVASDTSMAYVPILLASGAIIGLGVAAGTFLHKLKFRNHAVASKAAAEQDSFKL